MKNFNEKDFCLTLDETPWDTAFIFDDINDITDAWYCLLNSALDEHAPLVTKCSHRLENGFAGLLYLNSKQKVDKQKKRKKLAKGVK